jgi:hypothetical protein
MCSTHLLADAGRECWNTTLPSRADMGMCLSPCATRLAVPAGIGILYSLSTADGSTVSQLDCGTEVRAPPVTDPWQGLWWVVTHGRELLVVEPQSLAVAARCVGGWWLGAGRKQAGLIVQLATACCTAYVPQDGSTVSQLDCGTEVRAPPVTDPWQGLWWVVTHGRELLVVEAQSLAVTARWVHFLLL